MPLAASPAHRPSRSIDACSAQWQGAPALGLGGLSRCGSPSYCPPEIWAKKPYFAPFGDIWSLAVLL
jgi:serine/threonine protein kinase